jgi:hypothetical protein
MKALLLALEKRTLMTKLALVCHTCLALGHAGVQLTGPTWHGGNL